MCAIYGCMKVYIMELASLLLAGVLAKKAVVDNARAYVNRSNSIKDSKCTYKTYVQFTFMSSKLKDFMDEKNILSTTRNTMDIIADFLRMDLHQVKHWRLVFKPVNKSKSIFCVELLKNDSKKIKCDVFYIKDPVEIERHRYYLCGYTGEEDDIRKYACCEHSMIDRNYSIIRNNCQLFVSIILKYMEDSGMIIHPVPLFEDICKLAKDPDSMTRRLI